MSDLTIKMQELVKRCQAILDAMFSREPRSASPKTQVEYERQAQQLLQRARHVEGGLFYVVQSTTSASTFRKRLIALEHFIRTQQKQLARQLNAPVVQAAEILHIRLFSQLKNLQTLQRLRKEGMTGQRAKRRSKRQALAGLPDNWRIALCKRAASGQYLFPLIVLALTGCRPAELVSGVHLWRRKDEATGKVLIHFGIAGAKVKAEQGQPVRTITYDAKDPHPFVIVVNELLDAQPEPQVFAQISSAINLTVEIRRLARSLWPKHKQPITSYCFRHQFAADLKANGDDEATSRGLGHISAETRRVYGTASQASKRYRLRPLRIEVERPVKPRSRGPCTKWRNEPAQ
ncbi:MAG: integrase [Gammaproteobacteria bacterium]|nr:MAG: integrase [Gammaproteobacteria bacterium]